MMRWVSMSRQDAGVRLAAPLGPVIDAEHGDLADLGIGQRPDQPDQRAPGHDRAQCAGQPGPRAAGQRERDPLQQAPQSDRAALVPGGQPVHLLGERRHDAGWIVADEQVDLEHDLDRRLVSYLTARTLTGRMSGSRASRSADTWASAAGIWPLMCAVRASSVAKVSKMP